MSVRILEELASTGGAAALIVILGVSLTAAAASVLRTLIVQAFRTRRLRRALKGAKPKEREKIIIACGSLEQIPEGRRAEGSKRESSFKNMGTVGHHDS